MRPPNAGPAHFSHFGLGDEAVGGAGGAERSFHGTSKYHGTRRAGSGALESHRPAAAATRSWRQRAERHALRHACPLHTRSPSCGALFRPTRMHSAMRWQRLGCLQRASEPPAALGRRGHAARALPDREAVHLLLERTAWLLPDPAVQVRRQCAAAGRQNRRCPSKRMIVQPQFRPSPLLATLPHPTILQVSHVQPSEGAAHGFAVVRDDLTHPLLGGNKIRKLDGLWAQLAQVLDGASDVKPQYGGCCRGPVLPPPPQLRACCTPPFILQASDVVTCGGLQVRWAPALAGLPPCLPLPLGTHCASALPWPAERAHGGGGGGMRGAWQAVPPAGAGRAAGSADRPPPVCPHAGAPRGVCEPGRLCRQAGHVYWLPAQAARRAAAGGERCGASSQHTGPCSRGSGGRSCRA